MLKLMIKNQHKNFVFLAPCLMTVTINGKIALEHKLNFLPLVRTYVRVCFHPFKLSSSFLLLPLPLILVAVQTFQLS